MRSSSPVSVLTACLYAAFTACLVPPALASGAHKGDALKANEAVAGTNQTSGSAEDNTPNPTLKQNPIDVLRKFEPAADEEYTLGPGDEISIQFPGRPELASKQVVGPDGRITLAIAGSVEVTNLTREAAAQKIATALSSYYNNVTATVQVEKYGSNHISLLGNVKNPGIMNFDQTPTLLAALSRAGIETRVDGALPDRCVIYRGDQVVWVDVQGLLESGSPLADMRLRRNDIIFVPAVSNRTVTVMGQVMHPGEIVLKRNSNLATVIGDAGGPSDSAGSNPEIQVVHRSKDGKTQYIRFKDLLKPQGGLEVSLLPGDVIYVPKSGMAKVGFVMQTIAPFTTMGSFAAMAVR